MHADATAAVLVPSDDFFLARQPILGRDQQLLAFELLFRAAGEDEDAKLTDGAAATAAVISHASQLGMEQVVGDQLAFVNVDAVVLMSDFVRFLQPHKVILEILETVKPTPELLARVDELKNLGFKFAVDDVIEHSPELDQLISLIDIIKVDIKGVAPDALGDLVASLKKTGKRLLAEKVETIEEFKLCMELGFEYFQGYYFARPVILSGRKIAPTEVVLLRLLELVNSNADNQTIETAVKRDALVSLNLLRLVNSRAVPGPRIESLSQAPAGPLAADPAVYGGRRAGLASLAVAATGHHARQAARTDDAARAPRRHGQRRPRLYSRHHVVGRSAVFGAQGRHPRACRGRA
jgi:EAL and modified HD-GYP domain-containing signal transduction protein